VWDVDGNGFIEYGMGLRAVVLGHAYPPVVEAARRQMEFGANFTRPAAIEVECAERMLDFVGNADMVKFTKDGSAATSAAVKLSRAHTGRRLVAICSDHPFFSSDDWFIGTTAVNGGIPEDIRRLTVGFRYNDIGSVEDLFARHPGEIACLILEPERTDPPRDGFLAKLKEACNRNGAVLIFDEMITGFRYAPRTAQRRHGVVPDLSTYGKAMGNGFAVSALAGRRELMRLGGIDHERERVFLLSTTHGAETHALAAAMATMDVIEREGVCERLREAGERLRRGVEALALAHGVQDFFQVAGDPSNLIYVARDPDGAPSQPYRTLFIQETIKRGLILPSLVISHSHRDEDIDSTLDGIDGALAVYRRALEDGIGRYLEGRSVKPVYRRYCGD
jgi:glutamate-1-semialdehyde 2,1-aminomutase